MPPDKVNLSLILWMFVGVNFNVNAHINVTFEESNRYQQTRLIYVFLCSLFRWCLLMLMVMLILMGATVAIRQGYLLRYLNNLCWCLLLMLINRYYKRSKEQVMFVKPIPLHSPADPQLSINYGEWPSVLPSSSSPS